MRRLCLALLLGMPAAAQFTVYDPTNWGVNVQNVHQAIQTYQAVMQYKQIAENMAAFVHNPAQFLSAVAQIEQVAVGVAAASGMTTPQRIAQLQQTIRLQQIAMREAQSLSTLSNGNASNIGQLANAMSSASQELAELNAQLQHEQRVAYYQEREHYEPQAQIISNWRLK